jgi:hypothetical protein
LQAKDAEGLMSFTLIAILGFALALATLRQGKTPERKPVRIRVDRRPHE